MSTPEVMLIVVGNMLDKGEVRSSPLIPLPPSFPPAARTRTHATPIKEYSRQVPTSEGAAFSARTGCLFYSSRRPPRRPWVCMTEAFNEVVARIIDTPSSWHEPEEKLKSSGSLRKARSAAAASRRHHRRQWTAP